MSDPRPSCPNRAPARALGGRLRIVVPALLYHLEQPSGSSRLAYDQARYLAARGHEVWLLAQTADPGQPEHIAVEGLHVLRYHRPRWSPLDGRRRNVHQRRARSLLERYVGPSVDLVHCHALQSGAAALSLYADTARTCYSLHSPARDELLAATRGAPAMERLRLRAAAAVNEPLERECLRRAQALTCDSEFARRRVAEIHGGTLGARVTVVPGWVDLQRFTLVEDRAAAKARLGWPLDRPVFFCLRRLVPRMGLDRLIDAAASAANAGVRFHLVLAGQGPLRSALDAQVRALGVADRVTLSGRADERLLPMMYGAADAFVLPSAELECFGLVALESLACGRPVLASPVAAIPEVVGAIEPRWLARDASAPAVAALLAEYVEGRLPAHGPQALRSFVEERFAEDACLRKLMSAALGEGAEA